MLKNHKKQWTDEQISFLLDSYGQKPINYLIKKLKKSEDAIKLKMQELTGSYSLLEAGGLFTARQIGPILGVNERSVIEWIHHRELPAKRLREPDTNGVTGPNLRFYIDPSELWKWIESNKERIPFQHLQRGILLPEPDWLDQEVKKASTVKTKRPTNWSTTEKERAWNLYNQGLSPREISEILHRPYKGTQRQISQIRKSKYAPAPSGRLG